MRINFLVILSEIFVAIFFLHGQTFCQEKDYSGANFRTPVDIPIILSANFGELRSNHFHAGIDIKTQGVQGVKVYAIENGYISRIKVSPYGYGKALYITHPNGYVSVYGHLRNYHGEIADYVKNHQYNQKTYSIDIYPKKNEIRVAKGQLIALSGNSGGSMGPHLHFEIRDAKTEHTLNPLLFGFNVKDSRKPRIDKLGIFPLDDEAVVDYSQNKKVYALKGSNGKYYINKKSPIVLHGKIGFGVMAYDYLDGAHNKCGIYTVELQIGDKIVYSHKLDEFSFFESRYINSLKDYGDNNKLMKSFVEPGNKLSIYETLENKGVFNFNTDTIYTLKYILTDVHKNESELNFKVQSMSIQPEIFDFRIRDYITKLSPNERAIFIRDDIRISFPEHAFYDTVYFNYKKSNNPVSPYSDIHHVHNKSTPVHDSYTMSIKVRNMPDSLKSKALIGRIDDHGNIRSEGGEWIKGFMSARMRRFGKFLVTVDTIKPTIRPLYYKKNYSKIRFKMYDDLSGIKDFNGYIDGNWVLFEYDAKYNLIYYYFDENMKGRRKKHKIRIEVTDMRNNKAVYEGSFYK